MAQPRIPHIASIEIDPAYRPEWFVESAGAHVPLPPPDVTPPRTDLPGTVIVWTDSNHSHLPLISIEQGKPHSRYDWTSWWQFVVGEQYRRLSRPLYTRLPFHYHRIPGALRNMAARLMLSSQAPSTQLSNAFPAFPIEQGFELLVHVWRRFALPPDQTTPLTSETVLTHDVDTSAGYRWVKQTAELELAYGFQSVWNVVGQVPSTHFPVLDWLVDHGCSIGLHGYNHDNKLAFLAPEQIRRRLDACRPLIERYDIRCFRSPSWFRSDALFKVLADYVTVDYSRLDTDRSCPGGVGGCLWTKPFTLNGLTHVPTTVPFEDPLYWGHTPEQLVDFWRPKVDWLHACGGGIVVNTHPEPQFSGNARMLDAYARFLELLAGLHGSR